jgi:small subunit ribosomal protein S1
MTQPENPENPDTNAATPEAPAAPQQDAPAAAPADAPTNDNPSQAGADAPVAAESSSDTGGDDEGDDAEGDAPAGEGQPAAADAAGGPPKKKRRRRRKKKGPGAGAPAGEGAEAQAGAEGGEGGEKKEGQPHPQRPPRPKKPHVERERPAFNVGDVVFGKVLEVTEDVLFIDLSGKAKAIFDLRELLITDEDVEEYEKAHKREAAEIAAARAQGKPEETPVAPAVAPIEAETSAATSADEGQGAGAPEGQPEAAPEAAPPVETPSPAPVVAETSEAAPADASPADAPPVEASSADASSADASSADAPPADAPSDDKGPQLPRVVLEPGAPFVGLVHNDGGRGGLVVLTHHPKRVQKAKPIVAEASKSGSLVFGLVTGTIKGGVEVDVDGLRAFAPASHVELRPGADLSHLVGKRLPFAVTQYAKRGRDVVLSRRAMLESEAKEKREKALSTLKMGEVVEGIVRTIVPFGAFVDVGGVEGLVPLSEMSHNRADQPKDVFKLNESVKVKILRVDEKGKLWLSRRSAIEDPWASVAAKYSLHSKHKGKVARLQPFGAFIELEPGIDGLIHTADLSIKRIEHPEEIVKVGDEIDVVVANVDPKAHRIALHPAPTGEAANEEPQRIQVQKIVKVVVVVAENSGLTVRVRGATGRNARGFISASSTGTPRGTELRKLFPVGKELEAKIIEHDPRRGELKLSIRAMNEENERNAYQQYRAQVKREAKFGTFADLLAKRNITPNK